MTSDPGSPPSGPPVPEVLDDVPVRWRDEPDPGHSPDPTTGSRPSRRVWVWSVVVVALVATSVVWYADERSRADETTALAGCEHRLSEASALADIRMGMLVNYLRPSLKASHGTAQLHLADLMSGPARTLLPKVQRAHHACSQVRVQPWHFALVSRRNAAMAYSGALITLLETVASQGRAYFRHDPTLIRLRQAAGID